MKNTPEPKPKIIIDPALTAVTDDLNPDEATASAEDLNIDSSDNGLNHDKDDDLSLN